ncbi:NUDT19 [Cordylochernes scorpioides]|uniref:NUDT19 n=1 Tax=Cordylochernes scorpioides TaxID=51811 RepID=A0ABY6KTG4_9ARAC|nr:NUDT19 [Cordylochernes scorpioides]
MPKTEVPWREASSLIIAARITLQELVGSNLGKALSSSVKRISRSDYHLLMVKRSNVSSYFANAYVFPGGLVEVDDFSPKWWGVFEQAGVSRLELEAFSSRVTGPRPPMITDSVTAARARARDDNQDILPPDLAYRIAAIRETFEETGVLLVTSPIKNAKKPVIGHVPEWQKQIHGNSLSFIELCLQHQACPDVWSLMEWWDWLTPTSVGHRRYDTMFYVCCMDRQPPVVLDNNEVVTMKWYTPQEILEEHASQNMFMAPPQVYELSRLAGATSFQALRQHASRREKFGVERWLPVLATCRDGALSLLPGDPLYPRNPDYLGKQPGPDYPHTLEELRVRGANRLNRMEIRGPIIGVHCSCEPTCGHVRPTTMRPATIVQSYL